MLKKYIVIGRKACPVHLEHGVVTARGEFAWWLYVVV